MKKYLALALSVLICSVVCAQQSESDSEPLIVAGYGWGKVHVGAKREDVEAVLGKGEEDEGSKYLKDVYFREYPDKGIQVFYTHQGDKVVAIFFYNKQRRYENFVTVSIKTEKGIDWNASVKTEKGIDWNASPEKVKKVYGKPKENHSGKGWRRMVFEGIDFRWENGVMVRIGIPGT